MQTLSNQSDVAGAIPANLLRQERRRHKALARLRKLRQQARDEIERLITFLDESDIDPDLEPSLGYYQPWNAVDGEAEDDAEPSLGWTEQEARWGKHAHNPEDAEDEPSLASTASINQSQWAAGGSDDAEDEHDGAEPDEADYEPSIGFDACTLIAEMDPAEVRL